MSLTSIQPKTGDLNHASYDRQTCQGWLKNDAIGRPARYESANPGRDASMGSERAKHVSGAG